MGQMFTIQEVKTVCVWVEGDEYDGSGKALDWFVNGNWKAVQRRFDEMDSTESEWEFGTHEFLRKEDADYIVVAGKDGLLGVFEREGA